MSKAGANACQYMFVFIFRSEAEGAKRLSDGVRLDPPLPGISRYMQVHTYIHAYINTYTAGSSY